MMENLIPDYTENIIVGVIRNQIFRWYVTEKGIWKKKKKRRIDAFRKGGYEVKDEWIEELNKVSHREYTSGFSYHKTSSDDQIYNTTSYEHTSDFVGLVLSYDEKTQIATIQQRNHLTVGQEIEFFQPNAPLFKQTITEMFNDEGISIEVAPHPQQIITMKMDKPVVPYTILRRDC